MWPDVKIIFQYLAISSYEYLLNGIRHLLNKVQNLPNIKYTFKILPKALKILPKWQNFAKSGHSVIVANLPICTHVRTYRLERRCLEWLLGPVLFSFPLFYKFLPSSDQIILLFSTSNESQIGNGYNCCCIHMMEFYYSALKVPFCINKPDTGSPLDLLPQDPGSIQELLPQTNFSKAYYEIKCTHLMFQVTGSSILSCRYKRNWYGLLPRSRALYKMEGSWKWPIGNSKLVLGIYVMMDITSAD